MTRHGPPHRMTPNLPRILLFTGLSLSIGWGIRGNYGHEHGAMIAGALGAMAAVLLSGREDWHRRIAYFGLFGAIGWAFGGSISYMQVIGYTHSGHSASVLYGFLMLFVIGFLWAAIGGAGTALPAFLSREKLREFFVPGIVLFAALVLHEFAYDHLNVWLAPVLGRSFVARGQDYRQDEPLYWLDTSWTAYLLSIVVLGLLALVRRRWDKGSSLVMHMCVGWWIAFLLLPNLLGLRMTPPRGDSWAGCVGIVVGIWVYLQRNGLSGVTWASVAAGIVGGLGFAGATLFKLMEIKTGWETNYHSVLEQTYGLINGIGIGAVMFVLAKRAPSMTDDGRRMTDDGEERTTIRNPQSAIRNASFAWPHIISLLCLLVLIPWLNLRQNSEEWVKQQAIPEGLYWLSTATWYNIGWAAFALMLLVVLLSARRSPPAALPATWLGRGQWLYLIFLWIIVIGNFGKAITGFREQRLITEGVILLNAVVCSGLALLWPGARGEQKEESREAGDPSLPLFDLRRTALMGGAAAAACVVLSWGLVRAVWGDKHAGYSSLHVRFGPNATTHKKPKAGQPHP